MSLQQKRERWARKFRATFSHYLAEVGAAPVTNDVYHLTLQTRAGRLGLTVYDTWVACRFEEPLRAAEFVLSGFAARLNSYSGKWNFHFAWGYDVLWCLSTFRTELTRVFDEPDEERVLRPASENVG